jgi:transposase
MSPQEQAQMLAALRRARYGSLLALHVLRLCAAGRHPTEIAAFLFCARSRVYRMVRLYQAGPLGFTVDPDGQRAAPVRTTVLRPWLRRALAALLKAAPHADGWCRTRWSCATLAVERKAKHGLEVSAWTVRRWLHERGWVWKRAQLVANDDDPQRVARLARIRFHAEQVHAHAVLVCADALEIHLWPKVGAAWMPNGTQEAMITPGQHAQPSLAGALTLTPGERLHGRSARKTPALFRDRLPLLDHAYPAPRITRISVAVDHDGMHQAKAVWPWIESHPRVALRWFPTDCPQANPIERVFGDAHDPCTRNHKRKRLRHVVSDVERHLDQNGPWLDKRSPLYGTPEGTAAVERIAAAEQVKVAA